MNIICTHKFIYIYNISMSYHTNDNVLYIYIGYIYIYMEWIVFRNVYRCFNSINVITSWISLSLLGTILKFYVKGPFHETTKMNKINHRFIQIDRWILQTSRHR